MDLSGIIAISGKSGLFKVVTKGKNNIIVESLVDNKRFPAYASDRISAMEDISIYTYDEDAPLRDILVSIYAKEEGKEVSLHKGDFKDVQKYVLEILPNYDQERVYPSDLKKLFQWYNLLLKTGYLKPEPKEEAKPEKVVRSKKEVAAKEEKVTPAKKTPAKKTPAKSKAMTADKAKVAKPAAPKKVASVKTGSSRGK
jgi:hypothetical protein